MKNRFAQLSITLGTLLSISAGCAEKQPACGNDSRPSKDGAFIEREDSAITRIANAHINAGAANDAMLYPVHFTGAKLNSLGKQKVDALVNPGSSEKQAIYLVLPESDPQTASRKESLIAYQQERGRSDATYEIKSGQNSETYTNSGYGVERMKKTETGGDSAGSDASMSK